MDDLPPNLAPNVPPDVSRRIHAALLKLHARWCELRFGERAAGRIQAIRDSYDVCVRELRQANIALTDEGRAHLIEALADWAKVHGWILSHRVSPAALGVLGKLNLPRNSMTSPKVRSLRGRGTPWRAVLSSSKLRSWSEESRRSPRLLPHPNPSRAPTSWRPVCQR